MDRPRSRVMQGILAILVACSFLTIVSCGGSDDSSSGSSDTVTITKISLTPANSSIGIGEKQVFTALPTDSNGNTYSLGLTWTSSNTSVATVDTTGTAVGVSQGTTTITAAYNGVTSNTATLNVTAKIASIAISPMSSSVKIGATQQFTATALDSSGKEIPGVTISWFCSFAGVATIDGNGLVTGVSPGTVTIIASNGNISSQPAVLTVTQ